MAGLFQNVQNEHQCQNQNVWRDVKSRYGFDAFAQFGIYGFGNLMQKRKEFLNAGPPWPITLKCMHQ